MEQPPFTEAERQLLRHFIACNQRSLGGEWILFGALMLLALLLIAGGQFITRWLPAHLDSQGLAVCLRHSTLRHGIVWLPSEPEFDAMFKGAAAFGLIYGFMFGVAAWGSFILQMQARRVAKLLARVFPDQANTAPSSTNP